MCTALEKLKEEGREEGRQEGIRSLIFKWTAEGRTVTEIAELLRKPEAFVREVQAGKQE